MSYSVDVISADGKKAGKVSLPEAIFGAAVNIPLIHQVVVAQLAAARQGTHATKTRGQISGGGAKPWRQKGTGRARHGSRRAPQWTGGGVVFGPQPRSYAQRTPKKMIAAALRSVLSDRMADGKLYVIDGIIDGDIPSTKKAMEVLAKVGDYRHATVVLHRDEDIAWLSLRNVPEVHAIAVDQLNAYDVVTHEIVVFTKAALDDLLARFGEVASDSEEPAESVDDVPVEKSAKAAKAEAVVEEVADEKPVAKKTAKVKVAEPESEEGVTEEAKPEDPVAEATDEPVKKAKKSTKTKADDATEAEK